MIADDFLKLLLVVQYWISSIKVIILYNVVSMSSSPTSHTFMYITFSACQFKQVWCCDVDQMLYFTLEKLKRNILRPRPGPCQGSPKAPGRGGGSQHGGPTFYFTTTILKVGIVDQC